MLDAYIIDRIRREREAPVDRRAPLHIEVPREAPRGRTRPDQEPEDIGGPERDDTPRREREDDDRGIAIIDFTI